jgi:adenosine 3'-phospho 5'-phosphosulfate transporter B3
MGLSNTSLGYLNYPTQVIFKSCKLIPVMIGGVLIQGKTYGLLDLVSVLSMSVGLVFFVLADSQVQPNFDLFGVLLISLALCADAVIGNVQEKAARENSATTKEVIFFSYSIGFVYILVGLLVTGGLWPAFKFCLGQPAEVYGGAFVFSIAGYFGISFVLGLVRLYGALLAVTVTTLRKGVTLVISFLVFSKPFTMQYIYSGLIVVFGIVVNVYTKNRASIDHFFMQWFVYRKSERTHLRVEV